MGTDRVDDDRIQFGKDNGAPGRQRIGRGSCRRRDDQAVGLEGCQVVAVDGRLQFHDPGEVSPIDHHIVQNGPLPERLPAPLDLYVEHHPFFKLEIAGKDQLHRCVHLIQIDLGQISESPQIDPHDRHIPLADEAGCSQNGSVAAENDQQIDRRP